MTENSLDIWLQVLSRVWAYGPDRYEDRGELEQNSDRKVSKSDNDAYEDSQIVYKLRPRPKCEDSLPDFSVEYSLHRPYDKTHQVIESEEGQLNIKLNSIQSLKF